MMAGNLLNDSHIVQARLPNTWACASLALRPTCMASARAGLL